MKYSCFIKQHYSPFLKGKLVFVFLLFYKNQLAAFFGEFYVATISTLKRRRKTSWKSREVFVAMAVLSNSGLLHETAFCFH
ncbi:MAG: hypothetical protein NUV76_05060 [Candidatus Kuenenia sp.]|nr:hypothetical protein [Candidatus Kuenenia sp.]